MTCSLRTRKDLVSNPAMTPTSQDTQLNLLKINLEVEVIWRNKQLK